MPARRGCAEGSELVLQTGFEGALPYTSTIAACARKFECDLAKVEHPERYRNAAPISPVGSGERVRLISARKQEMPATAGFDTLDADSDAGRLGAQVVS